VNTAVALARKGKKTAVLDGDQTMAASSYLGYGVTRRRDFPERTAKVYSRLAQTPNMYNVVHGEVPLVDALVPARTRTDTVKWPNHGDDDDSFDIIPNLYLGLGSRVMSEASDDIRNSRKPHANPYWLRRAIEGLPPGFLDVIIVDFRGTYEALESSELAGMDYVVGVVHPDNKDDDTLQLLEASIQAAQEEHQYGGGSASLGHVLINGDQAKNRGKFIPDMIASIKRYYGDMVLPVISENVRVRESVLYQEPIHYWDPESETAAQFDAVAERLDLIW
jgi:cellulose biosynthesis protein BcsQ